MNASLMLIVVGLLAIGAVIGLLTNSILMGCIGFILSGLCMVALMAPHYYKTRR